MDINWKLWVCEGKAICDMAWDPAEYAWKDPFQQGQNIKLVPFFQYTVKLGRHILTAQRGVGERDNRLWQMADLKESFLRKES